MDYIILLGNYIESISSVGCYRFKDGSFMRYLNYSETNPNLRISAPIFEEKNQPLICDVSDKFTFIGDGLQRKDGQQWKHGTGSLFTISITRKEFNLKVQIKKGCLNYTDYFRCNRTGYKIL